MYKKKNISEHIKSILAIRFSGGLSERGYQEIQHFSDTVEGMRWDYDDYVSGFV